MAYASRIKEDVKEQWINNGLIVIDDNTRPISDSMDIFILQMNSEHKPKTRRFTIQQRRLQKQEAELLRKDLALKNKESQISELQRE